MSSSRSSGSAVVSIANQIARPNRLPAVPLLAFRQRRYLSSAPQNHEDQQRKESRRVLQSKGQLPTGPVAQKPSEAPSHANEDERDHIALTTDEFRDQLELRSTADALRRIFVGGGPDVVFRGMRFNWRVDAMRRRQKLRELRGEVGTNHRERADKDNPLPYLQRLRFAVPQVDPISGRFCLEDDHGAALLLSMDLIRMQISAINTPEDLIHFISETFNRPSPATAMVASRSCQMMICKRMSMLSPSMADRALMAMNVVRHRFAQAGHSLSRHLVGQGLAFAMRVLEPTAIVDWLRELRSFQSSSGMVGGDIVGEALKGLRESLEIRGELLKHASSMEREEHDRLCAAIRCIMFGDPGLEDDCLRLQLQGTSPSMPWSLSWTPHWVHVLGLTQNRDLLLEQWTLMKRNVQGLPDLLATLATETVCALAKNGFAEDAWCVLSDAGSTLPRGDTEAANALCHVLLNHLDAMPPNWLANSPDRQRLHECLEQGFANSLLPHIEALEKSLGIVWIRNDVEPESAVTMPGYHKLQSYWKSLLALEALAESPEEFARIQHKSFHQQWNMRKDEADPDDGTNVQFTDADVHDAKSPASPSGEAARNDISSVYASPIRLVVGGSRSKPQMANDLKGKTGFSDWKKHINSAGSLAREKKNQER